MEKEIAEILKKALESIGAGEYYVVPHVQGDDKYALEQNEVMSVELLYPYRTVHFSISPRALKWYEGGETEPLMMSIYHEAFHIWFWHYKELVAREDKEGYENEEENLAEKFGFLMHRLCK